LAAKTARPSSASASTTLLHISTAESSEKGAEFFFLDLDDDVAGGVSPNNSNIYKSSRFLVSTCSNTNSSISSRFSKIS